MPHPVRTLSNALAVFCAIGLSAGCATQPSPVSVVDTVARMPELSTLSKLITDAGLAETLRGAGPYTVFAPTDIAFKAVPAKTMTELASNKEALKAVLSFHVVPGKLMASEVKNGPIKSVEGSSLALSKSGTFATVEDAVVTQQDLTASNGIVHVIDRVLMPPKR